MYNSPSAPFHLLALFGLGSTEIIVVFALVVLLFGGAKLPSLARGFGQSIKEFKKASKDERAEAGTSPPSDEPKKAMLSKDGEQKSEG